MHKRWASSLRDPVAEVRNAYRGFGVTWLRASSLLTSFFIMADSLERHYPGARLLLPCRSQAPIYRDRCALTSPPCAAAPESQPS